MSVSLYSDRTRCPACKAKVCLVDVGLTPTFSCPACQEEIQISPLYHRTHRIAVCAFALLIAYAVGAHILGEGRYWLVTEVLVLALGIPFSFILTLLWLAIGRYLLPPKLVRCVPDPDPPSHFQGLGLGPK